LSSVFDFGAACHKRLSSTDGAIQFSSGRDWRTGSVTALGAATSLARSTLKLLLELLGCGASRVVRSVPAAFLEGCERPYAILFWFRAPGQFERKHGAAPRIVERASAFIRPTSAVLKEAIAILVHQYARCAICTTRSDTQLAGPLKERFNRCVVRFCWLEILT
jgi:hypothetical protein